LNRKRALGRHLAALFLCQKKFFEKIDFRVRSFSIFCTYISERLFLPEYQERRNWNV